MNYVSFLRGCTFAVCLSLCLAASSQENSGTDPLLQGIPVESLAKAQARGEELIEGGRENIMEVLKQVSPRGEDDDTSVRYLIDSAVLHANREGADAERRLLAECLGKALELKKDKEVRTFLLEMIARTDPKTARPIVARLTTDKQVGQDAVRALLYMHDPEVVPMLMRALPAARGRARAAILYGLGDMRAKQAATAIANVEADLPEVRLARAYALASLAAPGADDALNAAAAESTSSVQQARVAGWKLLYAERLAEAGKQEKAIEVAQNVLGTAEADDSHLRTAALKTLVDLQGENALRHLIPALDDENHQVRSAAVEFAVALPGSAVTTKLGEHLDELTTVAKVDLLRGLGKRGDEEALQAVTEQLRETDPVVRAEAVLAAAKVGGDAINRDLLKLASAEEKQVLDAVRRVLLQSRDQELGKAVAGAIPGASDAGKVMLLEVMATRNAAAEKEAAFEQAKSPTRAVRIAAIKALNSLASAEDLPRLLNLLVSAKGEAERKEAEKAYAAVARRSPEGTERLEPLLNSYEGAAQPIKASILSTLAHFGGPEALEVVTRETSSTEPEIQTAAIRALSEWSNGDALPHLHNLTGSENESHHVLAMRGYLRLLDAEQMSPGEKLQRYRQALKTARRDEEKRTIMTSLGDVRTTQSLRLLMEYQDNEDLAGEAALSVVKVVLPNGRNQPGLDSADAAAALLKALPHLQDPEQKKRAQKHINNINYRIETSPPPADEEGFVSLFNGEDLAGWVGSTDGYEVQDGAIVCIPEKGGNLYTERTYDNFVLRFEFKLTPKANNGLGIRAPLTGDPAFQAMEVQILDNSMHPNIKPWQRHGAIYGVAEAKDGHLRPTGEWNQQEVIARDGQITVKLNGATITDVNVWEIPTTGTLDGRPHPGLHRREGHIAFLGHGSRIEVKNIRIRELINEAPEGFTALFNGKNLDGWKGLVADPIKRREMPATELAAAQEKADEEMRAHWQVVNGNLVFDGDGSHLCTVKDYGDFEMLVDWKLGPGGDSGIYLRGSPQVQIWDPAQWPEGSGGLYNNQKNTSTPLVRADRPLGEWNTFRIKMVGDKVTVHLNDQLVVDNVTLENYWDRKQPIFPREQIELQSHGSPAFFRNIFIREL